MIFHYDKIKNLIKHKLIGLTELFRHYVQDVSRLHESALKNGQ